MLDLDNVKFKTEDNKEYVVLVNKCINNNYYGYTVNLHDESDIMIVKFLIDNNEIAFEIIDDADIVAELLEFVNKK